MNEIFSLEVVSGTVKNEVITEEKIPFASVSFGVKVSGRQEDFFPFAHLHNLYFLVNENCMVSVVFVCDVVPRQENDCEDCYLPGATVLAVCSAVDTVLHKEDYGI